MEKTFYWIINQTNFKAIAILKGLNIRIQADSFLDDLEIIDKKTLQESQKKVEKRFIQTINKCVKGQDESKQEYLKRSNKIVYTGKILHLDGDRRYAEKSSLFYKKMGLRAVVRSVTESRQPAVVSGLIERYKPDILVITGHDGMLRGGTKYNDIYNYRNSRYFINSVMEARRWDNKGRDLVIFAGACQSYYEAIIGAGANFASSPGRILIDFMDPLIVAEKIATTDESKYVTISDIERNLRDGIKGVNGIGAMGKKKIVTKM